VRCYVIVTISNLLVLFILVPCFRLFSSTFCTYVIPIPLLVTLFGFHCILNASPPLHSYYSRQSECHASHSLSIHLVVLPYHRRLVKDIYYSPYDAPYLVYYGSMAGIYSNYSSAPVVRGNRFAYIYIQWHHHHASRLKLKDKSQRQYKTC